MEVDFATNRLRRCYESSSLGERAWGKDVARKYIQRIDIIYAADSFPDLFAIRALKLHPLHGPHQGRFGITLQGRRRLVVTPIDGKAVRVEEVTNHYGD